MFYNSPKKGTILLSALILNFLFVASIFASESNYFSFCERVSTGEPKPAISEKKDSFTELENSARVYRAQGYEFQNMGDFDSALALYQKAVELDPKYAIAYNDLGIIYEAKGDTDRAEESYLKAVKIDPYFLSAYSNLAILYENKRDLEKAAYYWQKRFELGKNDDPWKERARNRMEDIRMVLSSNPAQEAKEKEALRMASGVAMKKQKASRKMQGLDKNIILSQKHFEKAKKYYLKRDYAGAFKEALDAAYLDPSNKEINSFIEKVQSEALTR